jgi:hypothetical protein
MSYSYDRYERTSRRQPAPQSSRRGTFSYWLPLAITVTAATAAIVAWVWSERNDDEDELPPPGPYPGPDHGPSRYGRNPDGSFQAPPSFRSELRAGEAGYGTIPAQPRQEENQSYVARMSGALRRTPSPQQFMEGASRSVVAGVAAAGAVVGSALSSIREEDKNAYKDHKTWSEEAEARASGVSPGPVPPPQQIEMRPGTIPGVSPTARVPVGNGRRKTVAVVVSADTHLDDLDEDEGSFHQHAVGPLIPAEEHLLTDCLVYPLPPPSKHGFLEDPTFRPYICSRVEGTSTRRCCTPAGIPKLFILEHWSRTSTNTRRRG